MEDEDVDYLELQTKEGEIYEVPAMLMDHLGTPRESPGSIKWRKQQAERLQQLLSIEQWDIVLAYWDAQQGVSEGPLLPPLLGTDCAGLDVNKLRETHTAACILRYPSLLQACMTASQKLHRLPRFTWEEVASHNHKNDVWIVVGGKVYDCTKFLPRHPGRDQLLQAAGKDATALFEVFHNSNTSFRLLNQCLRGVISLGATQTEHDAKIHELNQAALQQQKQDSHCSQNEQTTQALSDTRRNGKDSPSRSRSDPSDSKTWPKEQALSLSGVSKGRRKSRRQGKGKAKKQWGSARRSGCVGHTSGNNWQKAAQGVKRSLMENGGGPNRNEEDEEEPEEEPESPIFNHYLEPPPSSTCSSSDPSYAFLQSLHTKTHIPLVREYC
eukprot:g8689.t1